MNEREQKLKKWCEAELLDVYVPFVTAQSVLCKQLVKMLQKDYKGHTKKFVEDALRYMAVAAKSRRVPKVWRKFVQGNTKQILQGIMVGAVEGIEKELQKETTDMYIR